MKRSPFSAAFLWPACFPPVADRNRNFTGSAPASAAATSGLRSVSLGVGPVSLPGYIDRASSSSKAGLTNSRFRLTSAGPARCRKTSPASSRAICKSSSARAKSSPTRGRRVALRSAASRSTSGNSTGSAGGCDSRSRLANRRCKRRHDLARQRFFPRADQRRRLRGGRRGRKPPPRPMRRRDRQSLHSRKCAQSSARPEKRLRIASAVFSQRETRSDTNCESNATFAFANPLR